MSTEPAPTVPASAVAPAEPINILLVDDEPRNLTTLETILVDPTYRLLRAEDADSALKILLGNDVAAIVLDIRMPGTSGFELAQMIKATRRYRDIPILFLTAYLVEDADVITGYGAGAVDYLTKPLNPEIVRRKVAVFAELFRKTRALADLNEKLEQRVSERTADLERSEAALRAADWKKDEFIAVLAHELRNPLAPLRFGLEILSKQQPQAPPLVSKTLASMNRQLDHMVRLIDDLLDISRVTRGIVELKKERLELASVIQTAIEMNRPFIERRRHRLALELAPQVFSYGDPARIVQIVGNLLHNAAKFTADEGRISIELLQRDGVALIKVVDSGGGIDPAQVEQAFEMFTRIKHPDSEAEPGLGIGLALGRRLAELHGGTLKGSSEGVGRGTTFTLSLPVTDAAPAPASLPLPAPNDQAMPALDIVVIEDSRDIAEALAGLLEEMGHRVWVARGGASGLALIEEQRPTVVLCDLGLPEMDGIEVCRRVRRLEIGKQPLMVALTGWGRDDDRRRTKDAGFDAHLVKPPSIEALESVLRRAAT
jgi:signal transduction histidine kinase